MTLPDGGAASTAALLSPGARSCGSATLPLFALLAPHPIVALTDFEKHVTRTREEDTPKEEGGQGREGVGETRREALVPGAICFGLAGVEHGDSFRRLRVVAPLVRSLLQESPKLAQEARSTETRGQPWHRCVGLALRTSKHGRR